MKYKLMPLKIPCGWEIKINRFYDFQGNIPHSILEESQCKCLLLLERNVSPDREDHFVIILESFDDKNCTYRLTAAVHDISNCIINFESSDNYAIKEKLDKWIWKLSSMAYYDDNVVVVLSNDDYSDSNEKMMEHPLMPIMIPAGWKIVSNCFFDLECNEENMRRRLFSADTLFVESAYSNNENEKYIVSLDWLPYYDPEGRYVITAVFKDFNNVIKKFESKDRYLIQEKLKTYIDMVNQITYLKVDSVRVELCLNEIHASQRIKEGKYLAHLGEEWIPVEANEPYICTSGKPIRRLLLNGSVFMAEKILLLQAYLINSKGTLKLKGKDEKIIEIGFDTKRVSNGFFVSGEFLAERNEEEFRCRFNISGEKNIIGIAFEKLSTHGNRELYISEISKVDIINIIRDVEAGEQVIIESIPWI